jgi:hypothetical protein
MDGRKFDWIRKQLGLSKAELASSTEYRVKVSTGASGTECRDLLLWQSSIPGSHGVLEERSEPQEGMTRIPKGRQGIRCAKKKDLKFFVENVTVRYILAIQYLPKKQQKPCSLIRR